MKALKLAGLGLLIVGCSLLYGRVGPEKSHLSPLESVIVFGEIGIGAASCALVGLIILGAVRSRRLSKGTGILILLASSIASVFFPLLIMRAVMRAIPDSKHLFHGEEAGWTALSVGVYLFWLTFIMFLTFAVCVLSVKRPQRP